MQNRKELQIWGKSTYNLRKQISQEGGKQVLFCYSRDHMVTRRRERLNETSGKIKSYSHRCGTFWISKRGWVKLKLTWPLGRVSGSEQKAWHNNEGTKPYLHQRIKLLQSYSCPCIRRACYPKTQRQNSSLASAKPHWPGLLQRKLHRKTQVCMRTMRSPWHTPVIQIYVYPAIKSQKQNYELWRKPTWAA